jgi:hypothetical protein
MEEIWKNIEGYNGDYQISNLGKIISYKKKHPRVLIYKEKHGYHQIQLTNDCGIKYERVHRLVAHHFIKPIIDGLVVNHIDMNRQNNVVSNLEIISHRENVIHGWRSRNKSSIYTGVSKVNRGKNPWSARIQFNKKYIHLGYFKTELEAYQARVNYEKENGIQNKYL